MKKIIIIAAAITAMVSCQKNSSFEIVPSSDNDAIGFSAYTGTAVTKGTVVNASTISEIAGDGIGVFAFYQPANNGIAGPDYTTIKYPTPDFMYNQQVNCKTTADTWEYTPIKYWPNNTNDKVSFFAYAPYKSGTTWEDLNITTDATGKTINSIFYIYNDIEDQVDYLFAEPVLNMLKPTGTISTTGTGMGQSTDGADVVKFNFKHVTSKVNLYVGVETDAKTGNPQAWSDENTTIEIKSIEFKDLAQTFTWSKTGSADAGYSTAGKQNVIAKPYTAAPTYTQVASDAAADGTSTYCDDANGTNPQIYAAGTPVPNKFKMLTSAINYGLISNGWTNEWHRFLKGTQVAGGISPDPTRTTTADDEYMFIAPQALSTEEIIITYVVKTVDSADHNNDSEIINVIKKTWADFHDAAFTSFESGKQYNLYFLIGMQSVKLAATVTDWVDGTDHHIDVPSAY